MSNEDIRSIFSTKYILYALKSVCIYTNCVHIDTQYIYIYCTHTQHSPEMISLITNQYYWYQPVNYSAVSNSLMMIDTLNILIDTVSTINNDIFYLKYIYGSIDTRLILPTKVSILVRYIYENLNTINFFSLICLLSFRPSFVSFQRLSSFDYLSINQQRHQTFNCWFNCRFENDLYRKLILSI